jgi:hypothetical protein
VTPFFVHNQSQKTSEVESPAPTNLQSTDRAEALPSRMWAELLMLVDKTTDVG